MPSGRRPATQRQVCVFSVGFETMAVKQALYELCWPRTCRFLAAKTLTTLLPNAFYSMLMSWFMRLCMTPPFMS